MNKGTNRKIMRAHAVVAAAVGAVTAALLAPVASATVVTTDAFNYTPGDRLVGQTNPGTLKVWGDPPSPTQPAGAADLQRIQSGSLSYPGLAPATGNSFLIPNDTNSNIARLDFPAEQNITTAPSGLFYSFTMKLTSFTSLPAGTGTNQAGSAAVQNGAFVAGFFWGSNAGPPAGGNGMSVATSYGAQFRIRREVDANNAETGRYQLGIIKNNQPPAVGSVQYAWDTTHSYAVGETLLITASYKWNGAYAGAGQTDDETFLWVNGVPGDLQPAPTVTGPTGTGTVDMYASNSNRAQSFWFRSDGVQVGNLLVDELRIGQSYAEVTPSAPKYYWDIDGTNPGAGGGTSPSGLWDGAATNFNTDAAGGAGTLVAAPAADDIVYFAAGNGATGSYTVDVSGTRSAAVAHFKDGTIALNGGTLAVGVFDVAAGASASVSSVLTGYASGSGNVLKLGEGSLTLSGANTHTGGTTVNGGTVTALGASALGGPTNALAVNNPSTASGPAVLLNLSTTAPTTVGSLSGAISNPVNSATIDNGGQLFTVNQSTSGTYAGVITGSGGLTKAGTATLTLTGTNTYGGPTSVSAGTLRVSKPGALPGYNTPTNVSVGSGATLTVNAGGAGQWAAGDIDSLRGAAAFATGSTLGFDTSSGSFTYNSAMGGQHGVLKTGTNTLTLGAANTYQGDTTVATGTLSLGAGGSLADAGAVNVTGGTFDIGAATEIVGAVTLTSGSITGTTGALTGTSYAVQSGSISANLAGAGALAKTTAGTVTLSGVNAYSGGTTVNAGTLRAAKTAALPGYNSAGQVTGNAGGTIAANVGGAGEWTSTDVDTLRANATLNAGSSVGFDTTNAGGSFAYASNIAGAHGITKLGSGSLVLSGVNTYTGGTTVAAGTLVLANADATAGGAINVANGTIAQAQASLPKAVTVTTLATNTTGKFDLTNDSMVVKGMTVAQVQAEIAKAYNAGNWNGTAGLTSSTAAAASPKITAIGFASNGVLGKSEFKGVSGLDTDDVLLKYTYYGDSDLSGHTTLDDFTLFLGGYQSGGDTWLRGDYNYSGTVTLDDFKLFLAGYQQQGGPLSGIEAILNSVPMNGADRAAMLAAVQAVPEPAGLALLAATGAGLLARRRRRTA